MSGWVTCALSTAIWLVVEDIIFGGAAPHLTMTVYWRVADEVAGEIYTTDIRLEQAAWI